MSRKLTTEEFVKLAKNIHGDEYDYSATRYTTTRDKITVNCLLHGTFSVRASSHLQGEGCRQCANDHKALSTEEFIERSNAIHGVVYDYSAVKYINATGHVTINCIIHGQFSQQAYAHIQGQGCPICYEESKKLTTEEFIRRAMLMHGNIYDYSMAKYELAHHKIDIICGEHGVFTMFPYAHIQGQGCPCCKESKGERAIRNHLIKLGVAFESQKSFNDLKSPKDAFLFFDFHISDKNLLIEYDGRQHFEAVDIFGGEDYFQKVQHYDGLKDDYAKSSNIRLLRISHKVPFSEIPKILESAIFGKIV